MNLLEEFIASISLIINRMDNITDNYEKMQHNTTMPLIQVNGTINIDIHDL